MIIVGIASAAIAAVAAGLMSYYVFRPTSPAVSAPPTTRAASTVTEQPLVAAQQLQQWVVGESLAWKASSAEVSTKRQAGPYIIEITKDVEGDQIAPVVKVTSGVQSVTMRGEMGAPDLEHPITLFQNRANSVPVVMLQSFTGGAHCCYHVQLAGISAGQLKVLDLGSWETQISTPMDLNGDGVADFKIQDERFLYAFAPYANSIALPQFLNVVNGAVRDVSRDFHFRYAFADVMKTAGADCQPGGGFTANGACPAFVAAAARVGKLDEAWTQMVGAYDPTADWTLPTGCMTPAAHGCPDGQEIVYKSYPDAVRAFLVRNGYISPTWIPPEQRSVTAPTVPTT